MKSRFAVVAIAVTFLMSGCRGQGGSVLPSLPQAGHMHGRISKLSSSPTLVQTTTGALNSPASITVSFPSAPSAGDVLVVFFNNNASSNGSANTYTAPSGWTQVDVDTSHAYSTYEAFYHVVGTGEPDSYVFTPSCACREQVWIGGDYSGVNTSTPIDGHGFTFVTSGTNWTTPSETPSQTGDIAVVSMMPVAGGLTWTNATGWTKDLGPAKTWSTEILHQALSGTSAVSETSTLSAASSYPGYAAIVLLAPASTSSPSPSPSPNNSYAATILGDSPTAYYQLNDTGSTAADSSGNGLNGTVGNGVTEGAAGLLLTSNVTAMGFPGTSASSGIVSVPQTTMLQPANAVSLEAWIRFPSNPALWAVAVGYGTDAVFAPYNIWFDYNNEIAAQWDLSSGQFYIVDPTPLQPNTTYHVVSTYDGTNARLYVNGALVASGTKPGTLTGYTSGYGFAIGDDAGFSDPGFKGTVAQVAVYAGKALTSTQVIKHYNAGTIGSGPSPSPSPGPKVDWPTWGMKPTRNSYNPVETTLTTANVGSLTQLWSTTLGGVITDEPVIATNVTGTSEGTADVLYVGDAHANFYALDANSGAQLWSKTLQTTTVNGSQTGCYDQPGGVYGIGGSQTIDRSSSLVYVVDGNGNLYAYDLATGNLKTGPVAMWPFNTSGANITNDYGGLNEDTSAGLIYVPAGAHCGLSNYGGVESYSISSATVNHFYTEGPPPNNALGGVWGPGGVVIDPRSTSNSSMNNIYFGTAYGAIGPGQYPYSVVRMTDTLSVVAANNPVTQTCCPDLDFGDTPLVFTPSSSSGCSSTLVAAESKDAVLYVYNADAINNGPTQEIQLGSSSEDGQNLGTAAYYPPDNMVYIQNGSDSSSSNGILHGLVAFTVTSGCQLSFAWEVTVGPNQITDGPPAPPTVANGVVYYSDAVGTSGCTPVGGTCTGSADFYAFDASNGSQLFHTTLPVGAFTPPVVVNGRVYLTSWNGQGPGVVYCYGLPGEAPAAAKRRLPKH